MGTIPEKHGKEGWGWTEFPGTTGCRRLGCLPREGSVSTMCQPIELGKEIRGIRHTNTVAGLWPLRDQGQYGTAHYEWEGLSFFGKADREMSRGCVLQKTVSIGLELSSACWNKHWASWELWGQNWWGHQHGEHCAGAFYKLIRKRKQMKP